MVFPKMENAYSKFSFEITFKPERPDGLILYNGQRRGSGDYIALSLNDGYPEFRFDFGNQPAVLRAEKPVTMGDWHTVKVNRVRKDGYLAVDDQEFIPIPSRIRFQGLDLVEPLYLGGVPRFEDIAPTSSTAKRGYVGCISNLILREQEIELKKDFTFADGVTSCEPCAEDPCANEGVCLETQTSHGFSCVCAKGYTGNTCNVKGDSCSVGACGTGSCLDTESGVSCLCPVNRTGDRCEIYEPLDPSLLEFRGNSFTAYRTPKASKLHFEFAMMPSSYDDALLAYVAESEKGNGDFAAVVLKDRHVEFRFSTGASLQPVIIRSNEPVELNKWTDVIVGRRHGEGYLQVGGEPELKGRTPGAARSMLLKTLLYVGGHDNSVELHQGTGIRGNGFNGRISNLKVSSQPTNMVADIVSSANVRNAKSSHLESEDEENEIKDCPEGYSGPFCDRINDKCLALDPCMNGGTCQNTADDLVCNCPMGFTGDSCQFRE